VVVVGAALLAAACLGSREVAHAAAVNKAALQPRWNYGQNLLVPGAVVILRTPIGDFSDLRHHDVPRRRRSVSTNISASVRIRRRDRHVILQQVQEGLLSLDDPVSSFAPTCPTAKHHHQPTVEHAQWPVQLQRDARAQSDSRQPATQGLTQDELFVPAFKNPPYFPLCAFHY
jgi:D-alanyl-D-alanine carboxypeptidase